MINSVRGTKDILPEEIPIWYFVESTLRKVSQLYGFREIRLPIFEKTEVFQRSIGEATDIVNKEMYTFLDRGGESITLRPELTASVVRSVIMNNLLAETPLLRLWYYGPLFRYERPQKGRLRQFHQYGAELIGSNNPEADVETISLAIEIIKRLGINEFSLLLNSLGNQKSRQRYKQILVDYLKGQAQNLSKESQERLNRNPLRILDSKDPQDIEIIKNSPLIHDYLDEESREHYLKTKELLDSCNIKYIETPNLVRGLDYYSHTVFEFQSPYLGAQDSFGGGGRYNELFSQFGYKNDVPAIGFALGIERIILILQSQGFKPQRENPKVYIAYNKPEYLTKVLEVSRILRQNEIPTIFDLQKRSLKAQLKEANKSGVMFAIIIGDDEVANETLSLKNMVDGTQVSHQFSNAIDFIINSLK
ncbi:histidine--tRNA ligase [Bacteroidetes/Chlorobi group bacterium Naka2016]|jgi:histidyl-tRNA synthetase|nr:MAG: histidine--tRNA ligase [Bacteroidetes/Chlorobi group bacterium Naka2016]